MSVKIKYDKGNGEPVTERYIIPTNIPVDYISAFDVSELNEDEQKSFNELYNQYLEYVELYKKRMFKFEDWLEHVNEDVGKLKYRRFKIDKTEIL